MKLRDGFLGNCGRVSRRITAVVVVISLLCGVLASVAEAEPGIELIVSDEAVLIVDFDQPVGVDVLANDTVGLGKFFLPVVDLLDAGLAAVSVAEASQVVWHWSENDTASSFTTDAVADENGFASPGFVGEDGVFGVGYGVSGGVVEVVASGTGYGLVEVVYEVCVDLTCSTGVLSVFVGIGVCDVQGTEDHDVLLGGPEPEVICGFGGDDLIEGGGGDDVLFGGSGSDSLLGGKGDDVLYGGPGDDYLFGGHGADSVFGEGGSDETFGGPGNDRLSGGPGGDLIEGEAGDDWLFGAKGPDELFGGASKDVLFGGRGADWLNGGAGSDSLFGGRGQDLLEGGAGEDVADGGAGFDVVLGGPGADRLSGGDGDDEVRGGRGDDLIDGGEGLDTVFGGRGFDNCWRAFIAHGCEGEFDELGDLDNDGVLDIDDDDIDGDGVFNSDDAFPNDPNEWADLDGDGVGDNADVFPEDATEWVDSDGDGVGENADVFPDDETEWADSDGDGVGDNSDVFPNDPSESADSDGDGVGDNSDVFPDDETEWADSDGDGFGDNWDAFPNDPSEFSDADRDGIGDNEDPDDDNDGVPDLLDAFVFDPDESADLDGDGIGDNRDSDVDGDFVSNENDPFPYDGTEWADLDGDGVGDNSDPDIDGDGVNNETDHEPFNPDVISDLDVDGIDDSVDEDIDGDGVANNTDAFPFDSLEWADLDGDGIGNIYDDDPDGDGAIGFTDDFPLDPTEWSDTDGDGIGDNSDPDIDGDGILNEEDSEPYIPQGWVDSDGDGVADVSPSQFDFDGDGVVDVDDPDIDGDGVVNEADVFPRDSSEWSDFDGDGLGDFVDLDANGDGVLDLLSGFSGGVVSGDRDNDGIPDVFDVDGGAGSSSLFKVVVGSGDGGVGAEIVTEEFLFIDDVSVRLLDPQNFSAISAVAGGQVVDFEILSDTDLVSARLSLPFDPALVSNPKVLWFDESVELWVQDGEDLVADFGAGVVEVTVDHFSSFVVVDQAAEPLIAQGEGFEVCEASDPNGVSVVFVVDLSGSTTGSFVNENAFWPSSDVGGVKRSRVVDSVVSSLNLDRDSVSFIGYTDKASQPMPAGWGASSDTFANSLNQVLAGSNGSSDGLIGAVEDAVNGFTDQGVSNGVVVVVSDFHDGDRAGFNYVKDLAVSSGFSLHAVSLRASGDDQVSQLSSEGAFVSSLMVSGGGLDTLSSRIVEQSLSGGGDSDGDLVSDCDELIGRPLARGVVWSNSAQAVVDYDDSVWVKTDPHSMDSDGDFVWDSEELIEIDLTLTRFDDYQNLLNSGLRSLYIPNGDPRTSDSPVSLAPLGVDRIFSLSGLDDRLAGRHLEEVDRYSQQIEELIVEIQNSAESQRGDSIAALIALFGARLYSQTRAGLSGGVGQASHENFEDTLQTQLDARKGAVPELLSARPGGDVGDIEVYQAWKEASDRLNLLFSEPLKAPGSFKTSHISVYEADLLYEIQRLHNELNTVEVTVSVGSQPKPVFSKAFLEKLSQRNNLLKRLLMIDPGVDINQMNRERIAIEALVEWFSTENDGAYSDLFWLSAYRVVKLGRSNDDDPYRRFDRLEDWAQELSHSLSIDSGRFHSDKRRALVSGETQAANRYITAEFREQYGATSTFFSAEQQMAFALILVAVNTSLHSHRDAVYEQCQQNVPTVPHYQGCDLFVPIKSVTYSEFSGLFQSEIAQVQAKYPNIEATIEALWDDIALVQEQRIDWREAFVDQVQSEHVNRSYVEMSEHVKLASANFNPDTLFGSLDDDSLHQVYTWTESTENWPNLITDRDVKAVTAAADLFQYLSALPEAELDLAHGLLGNAWSISEEDLAKLSQKLPAPVAQVIENVAKDVENLDIEITLKRLAEGIAVLGAIATVVVGATTGTVPTSLVIISLVAGVAVAGAEAVEGNYGAAALEIVFLASDGAEIVVKTVPKIVGLSVFPILNATTDLTKAGVHENASEISDTFMRLAREFGKNAHSSTNREGEIFEYIAEAFKHRPANVTVSPAAHAAYVEHRLAPILRNTIADSLSTTSQSLTDGEVDMLVNALLEDIRPEGIDLETFAQSKQVFNDYPHHGPLAFETAGDKAFDQAYLDEIIDLCDPNLNGGTDFLSTGLCNEAVVRSVFEHSSAHSGLHKRIKNQLPLLYQGLAAARATRPDLMTATAIDEYLVFLDRVFADVPKKDDYIESLFVFDEDWILQSAERGSDFSNLASIQNNHWYIEVPGAAVAEINANDVMSLGALPIDNRLIDHEFWENGQNVISPGIRGHAITRHVGRSKTLLEQRVRNSGISAASTFNSYSEAQVHIEAAINANVSEIFAYFNLSNPPTGKGQTLAFAENFGHNVGLVHLDPALPKPYVPTTCVKVVLRTRANDPGRLQIVTAFPVLTSDPNC